ncbi:MAG: hypothetical protein H7Y31_00635 [Chitinophagaceae bacterium]|nr:hypothetical protein [Chitinophagaceae bacterium]
MQLSSSSTNMIVALVYGCVFTVILSSCNFTDKKTNTDSPEVVAKPASRSEKECYHYYSGRDTVLMDLFVRNGRAEGKITYQFFEKDRNDGNFSGELKGDTLVADYEFNSEGTKSTRQVVFLKQGDKLTEGYGDVEEKNGKMVFKNLPAVTFGNVVLTKGECIVK